MSKNNNLLNNNISNGYFSENHSLQQNSTSNNHNTQQLNVDKNVWDMYQLLMQNATALPSTANTSCQQNETTPTLDQLLLAATCSKLSPPQTTTTSTSQQNPSPILVVINNNSHNTSLNHHSNPMINLVNTCTPQSTTPQQQQYSIMNSGSPSNFDNQFNMSSDLPIFNFQQFTNNNSSAIDSTNLNSSALNKFNNNRGIQKSHKMNKLTQHVSSIHSSPTTSELNSSPVGSSTTATNPTASMIKKEKFSRPLLKNETVLCEKNPKFKQNYFVFEKKKEKTPISFHNISVNEIISGEIQSGANTSGNNSPKLQRKSKKALQSNTGSIGNNQNYGNMQTGGFVQYPLQVFQQHASQSMQSLDSSSASNQSSPMIVTQSQPQQLTQYLTQPNIRMTHSPNTSSNSSNNSNHHQQMAITHQLLATQQLATRPSLDNSSVLGVLLNQQGMSSKLEQELSSCLNSIDEYTPINSFSTNNMNNNMMNQINPPPSSLSEVDNLLASLPPVVESLFPQVVGAGTPTINEAANNTASFNSEVLPSSQSFLPDDFILEEDLTQHQNNHQDVHHLMQELSQEQWTELLEQYIAMMNKNN